MNKDTFQEQLVSQNTQDDRQTESHYEDKPLRSDSMSERGSFNVPANPAPKKIARKCPIVVDVIFVLMQLGLSLTFGFFSYYYDAIDRPCSAAYGNQIPLPSAGEATIGVNI